MAGTGVNRMAGRLAVDSRFFGSLLRAVSLPVMCGMMVANLYFIFMWAPTEQVMGHVQRIMYFHVAIAWVAFLAFFIVFIGSVMYLWKRNPWWDSLAHSAAEIGVVFATLVLITGTIWMRPVWGVWWTWEPKLTTSVILWLIYIVYLMVRAYAPNRTQAGVYSGVLGVVGFVDVPIVYFAATWWRSVHPGTVVGPFAEPGSLDGDMRTALLFSVITFTLLFAYVLKNRLSLKIAEDMVKQTRFAARLSPNPLDRR